MPDAVFEAEMATFTQAILANAWFSLRAKKRLYRETEGLPLRTVLSHEIRRSEGRGPDMDTRMAGFMSKGSKLA